MVPDRHARLHRDRQSGESLFKWKRLRRFHESYACVLIRDHVIFFPKHHHAGIYRSARCFPDTARIPVFPPQRTSGVVPAPGRQYRHTRRSTGRAGRRSASSPRSREQRVSPDRKREGNEGDPGRYFPPRSQPGTRAKKPGGTRVWFSSLHSTYKRAA